MGTHDHNINFTVYVFKERKKFNCLRWAKGPFSEDVCILNGMML